MFRPSDFPCDIQAVACGGYGGNHQIHHPPLVVKGYILPSVEVAGTLADLFRADGFHRQLCYPRQKFLLALYGRQSFIWVLFHVFPPFFLSRSPRKGFLPHSCGVFQRWHAPRTSGHFVPKWLVAVLPLPGYSFSDGHSFFKVQLIDELP